MKQETVTISKEEFDDLARKIELKKHEVKILQKGINEIEKNGVILEQETVTVHKQDWNSMRETGDILNDEETMRDLMESEENRRKGIKFKKFDI
jgi:PHD/YefM family antitoxin component YafN of YafNO toxin-antitoxin module